MTQPLSLERVQGVAVVTLDDPNASVNVLTSSFMQELESVIAQLETQNDLTAVVLISSKSSGFVAGADISEIEGVSDPEVGAELARNGQQIFTRLEKLNVPVVAALHGHCMGGGTELALACHFRIAADNLAIALPETRLGILPGFGGSQRLPRLVPLRDALDMILSGKTLRAKKAYAIGLVDQVVSNEKLRDAALDLARAVAVDPRPILARRRSHSGGILNTLMNTVLGRKIVFSAARKKALKTTGGHYPAPLKALDVIKQTFSMSLERGLEIEAQALGELITTPVSKNLIYIFHLSQRHRKQVRSGEGSLPTKAAVLGAGVMGSGIAQLIAEKGIPVVLKDLNAEAVDKGLAHIREGITEKFAKRGKGEDAVEKTMSLVTGCSDFKPFVGVELTIEAVLEKLEVKQQVLKELEPHLGAKAIFATNTSALSVTRLQSVGERPAQVGGLHFFNPVSRMPLVEVIRGDQTSKETLDTLFAFADKLGKTPIVVADRPGFLVNRLLMVYLNEAGLLAQEGYDWLTLDRMVRDFGLPMGPFRLIDEVGIDVAAEVGHTLCSAFSYLPESLLMSRACEQGLLGKKGGKGFYTYEAQHKPSPNLAIDALLDLKRNDHPGEKELQRMLYLMVNEAARCLEEQVVSSPEDIDTGMIFGIGFPPFRGGLCRWAEREGMNRIADTLEGLAAECGERFAPQGVVARRASFYR